MFQDVVAVNVNRTQHVVSETAKKAEHGTVKIEIADQGVPRLEILGHLPIFVGDVSEDSKRSSRFDSGVLVDLLNDLLALHDLTSYATTRKRETPRAKTLGVEECRQKISPPTQ